MQQIEQISQIEHIGQEKIEHIEQRRHAEQI